MSNQLTYSEAPRTVILPGFEQHIREYDFESLSQCASTIYGVDANLRLAYLNPAWGEFAASNNGEPAISQKWGLGRNILEACPEAVRLFYQNAYREAISAAQVWEHDFECSSPTTYRLLHQMAYPLREASGLLIVNIEVHSGPHDAPQMRESAASYRDEHGYILQCCHCRKIKHRHVAHRWDWIPEWVSSSPENTSHGLCQICLDHHYGD